MTDHYVSLPSSPITSTESGYQISITALEKTIIGSNAAITGIGTTAGIIGAGVWFLSTPVQSVGLGVSLGSATMASIIITGVGFASLAVAIPIVKLTYESFVKEANSLNQDIEQEWIRYQKKREKLFFDLLRLHSLMDDESRFNLVAQTLLGPHLIKPASLTPLIHAVFATRHADTLTEFLKNTKAVTHKLNCSLVMDHIKQHLPDLSQRLDHCFKTPPIPNNIPNRNAVLHGVGAGLGIASASLGVSWTFAALVTATGLAAAVPFIGWAILGISCIALGVMFGVGVGICKKRNTQREMIKNHIKTHNEKLHTIQQNLQNKIYRHTPCSQQLSARLRQDLSEKEREVGKLKQVLEKSRQENKKMKRELFRIKNTKSVNYSPLHFKMNAPLRKIRSLSEAHVDACASNFGMTRA
jgi:hypothetical protein